MIFPNLMGTLRMARSIARTHPDLLSAQLDRVHDQLELLLKVEGPAAEPLHAAATRMALLVFELEDAAPGRQVEIFVQLSAEAANIERLERAARNGSLLSNGITPRHWLPQTLRAGTRNTPFTVIAGGRW